MEVFSLQTGITETNCQLNKNFLFSENEMKILFIAYEVIYENMFTQMRCL